MRIGEATADMEFRTPPVAVSKPAGAPAAPDAAAAATRQQRAAAPVPTPKIESVTRQIDSYLRSMNKSLQFSVDQVTGETVVAIRDDETGEIIRQVPDEDVLRIAQRIEDTLSAMLDEKA